jgi:hypothetical protein
MPTVRGCFQKKKRCVQNQSKGSFHSSYFSLTRSIVLFSFAPCADGFVTAMERFGFKGVDAFDIVNTGMKVREELALTDPEKAAGLYVDLWWVEEMISLEFADGVL